MRLDRALVELGMARSRAEAHEMVARGSVRIDGHSVSKPSVHVDPRAVVETDGSKCPYVSRGGVKLAAALDAFSIDPAGRECLDVGASTGGFTDCLLQRGAARVTAVDVGHGQMAPTVAESPRVVMREGVNARDLQPSHFEQPFHLVVADVSFISLTLVLGALAPLVHLEGDVISLVKPQFEVGAAGLGKRGIVRDPLLRESAVERVLAAAESCGLDVRGRIVSPIFGGDGNVEFLVWFVRQSDMIAKGEINNAEHR